MPIHDHRGGNIPGGYDPNAAVNGAPPPEPTAEQIAAFKAQMADELAAKQAANEKETHESRKIVARELHHRAIRVDFQESFAIKETALFSGPDGVDKAKGGSAIPGVEMQIPVIAHAGIHVHEIPVVDGVRGKTLERHEAGHPAEPGDPRFGTVGNGKPIPVAHDVNAPQDPEVKLERIAGARVRAVTMPETDPLFVVPGQPAVFESKAVIPPAISVETGSLDPGNGNRPRYASVLPEAGKPPEAFGIPEFTSPASRIKPFFQRPTARAVVPEGQYVPQGVVAKVPGQEVPYSPDVSAKAETPLVPGEGIRSPFDPGVRVTMPESRGLDPRHTSRFVSDRSLTDIPQQGSVYFPSQKSVIVPPVGEKPVVAGAQDKGPDAIPFAPVPGRSADPAGQDPILLDPIIAPETPEAVRFTIREKAVPGIELPPEAVVPVDTRVPGDTHVSLAHVEILRLDPAESREADAVAFKPVEHGIEAVPEGNPILAVREAESEPVPVVGFNGGIVPPAEKPLFVGAEIPLDGSNPEDQIRAQQDLAFQGSQPVRFAEGVYTENPEVKPVDRLINRAEAGTEGRPIDHDRPGEVPLAGEDDTVFLEQPDRKRADRIDDHEDDLPPVFVPGHMHRPEGGPILFNVNPGYVPPSRDQHETTLAHEVVNMVDRFLVTAEQGSYVSEVHMTMNHEILPGTEILFRQVGNSLVVTFVNMDGGNLELLRRETPDLAESLRTHTGEAVEIRIVTAVGGETV